MIIRPITPKDLDALMQIAVESGPGFTSLMPDRDALSRKIDHSVESFARTVTTPGDEHYLFVLEDSATVLITRTLCAPVLSMCSAWGAVGTRPQRSRRRCPQEQGEAYIFLAKKTGFFNFF